MSSEVAMVRQVDILEHLGKTYRNILTWKVNCNVKIGQSMQLIGL